MTSATGVRIGWPDLPQHVKAGVEAIIGDRVVAAVSQPGGFSPGSADRVRTAGGRRAFVKAVSSAQNEQSPVMHRREAQITASLPSTAPAPALLGCYDDGDWVALVLGDVPGRHPATPWMQDELERVLDSLDAMAARLTPAPVHSLPPAATTLGADFAGWQRIAEDPPADLDPWVAAHLDDLNAAADSGLAALAGETLVHLDLRADNVLLSPDGSVTIVDWPWASRGPAWLDTLLLLVNVRLYGGQDTDALIDRRPRATRPTADAVTGVLAGLAGFFADAARQPSPPGLPTLRAFQHAQAAAVLGWLRGRMTA